MHQIRHIELEITTSNAAIADGWEEKLSFLGTKNFWSPLEAIFDRYSTPDVVLQFDYLSLTFNIRPDQDWKQILQEQIQHTIEEYIAFNCQYINPASVLRQDFIRDDNPVHSAVPATFEILKSRKVGEFRILPSSQQKVEFFFYYLLHGVLPWAANPLEFTSAYLEDEFPEALRQHPDLWQQFVREHRNHAEAISWRLTAQCPQGLVEIALQLLAPETAFAVWRAGRIWVEQIQWMPGFQQINPSLKDHLRQQAVCAFLLNWPTIPAPRDFIAMVAEKWLRAVLAKLPVRPLLYSEEIQQSFQTTLELVSGDDKKYVLILKQVLDHYYESLFKSLKSDNNQRNEPHLPVQTKVNDVASLDFSTMGNEGAKNNQKQEPYLIVDPTLSGITADFLSVKHEVAHAGMVLLYPYVQYFFRYLNLFDSGGQFRDETAREHAVYWWHYLACGQLGLPEHSCVLGKVLCGMPISAPLFRQPAWRNEDLSESERLLKAFSEHSNTLKNSSIEAIRETFLQRRGRLENLNEEWHLSVETQTVDILLEHLPYPISYFQMQWMKNKFTVHWI